MKFSGTAKLDFLKRLGDSWRDLSDALEIPAYIKRKFAPGDEPRAIWEWLADRDRLKDLPTALAAVDREDLTKLLMPDESGHDIKPAPSRVNQPSSRTTGSKARPTKEGAGKVTGEHLDAPSRKDVSPRKEVAQPDSPKPRNPMTGQARVTEVRVTHPGTGLRTVKSPGPDQLRYVELLHEILSYLDEIDRMTMRPSNLIHARSDFDQAVETIAAGFRGLAGYEALEDRQLEQLSTVSDDFVAAADSLLVASGSRDNQDSRYTAEHLATGRDLWPHFREQLRRTLGVVRSWLEELAAETPYGGPPGPDQLRYVELLHEILSYLDEIDRMTMRPSNLIHARSDFDQAVETIAAGFRGLAGYEALEDRQLEQLSTVSDDFVAAADSLLVASGSRDNQDSRYTAEHLATGRDLWPHFREQLRRTLGVVRSWLEELAAETPYGGPPGPDQLRYVELLHEILSYLDEIDRMTMRPSNLIHARSDFDQAVETIAAGFRGLAGYEALEDRQLEQLSTVSDDFVAAADSLLVASGSRDNQDSRYTAEHLATGRDLWPHFREQLRRTLGVVRSWLEELTAETPYGGPVPLE